jgi:glycosyltransferase involved in cell wall biosynthesis
MKFLQSKDYDVSAICSAGKWAESLKNQGIKIKTIKIKRKVTPFSDLIALLQLFFYFKKEKFQIVHTFTPKPGLLGQMAARLAGVPIVFNTVFGFYFHERTPYFKKRFFILIEKIAAKYSDAIFFRNIEDFETAKKEKIGNINLIRHTGDGIDILRFSPERFTPNFIQEKKNKLGIPADKIILGIVARLVREKGYLELFSAFKKVIGKFPNAMLLVLGSADPEKKDAINLNIVKTYGIEKNTLFLGERTDVDEIYALMDIFVLPSHREGFSHSIMEASAMAKPIIASDIRGCRGAVEPGVTGILVPPKNYQKLAEAIIYLLSNPRIAKQMGEAGRKKAEEEFDERLVFEKIKEEYDRLIKEKL